MANDPYSPTPQLRVLVPTDMSEDSAVALDFLSALGARLPVYALVVHKLERGLLDTKDFSRRASEAGQALDTFSLRLSFDTISRDTQLLMADRASLARELAIQVRGARIDLVVLVEKRPTGAEWLRSSHLKALLRALPAPTLVLDAAATGASAAAVGRLHRLLFATDFSSAATRAFLALAPLLARLGAEATLAQISTPDRFETQRGFRAQVRDMQAALAECAPPPEGSLYVGNAGRVQPHPDGQNEPLDAPVGPAATFDAPAAAFAAARHFVLYNDETPALGLIHAAEDHLADAIVLAPRPRAGLAGWSQGSLTEAVIAQTRLPVLVLPG